MLSQRSGEDGHLNAEHDRKKTKLRGQAERCREDLEISMESSLT